MKDIIPQKLGCDECGVRENVERLNVAPPRSPTPEYRSYCQQCKSLFEDRRKYRREHRKWLAQNDRL